MLRDSLKPYGAFLEYTVKPLIDDCRELLAVAEKQGVPLKDIKRSALILYIFHEVMSLCITFGVTFAICFTALRIMK